MDGTSLTPEQEKLNALRQVLPEAFSEGKIDWEKLKATLGENINFSNERYVLNWAGKSDAFKVLQTPSTKTLVPAKEESVNFDETENIFIEGENLEVLKVLQKSYFGKVKMIYIDPPYNTGNDSFIYPDKFSETKDEYQRRVGDKDEEGYMTKDGMFRKNSKENGQYHSNWLNMMMPRLYLAKNLLRQDGVIFVSIDDNEVHNLRLLMNEIFGEDNFVASIIWQKKYAPQNDAKWFTDNHDYIILFAKSKTEWDLIPLPRSEKQNKYYINDDNDGKGIWRTDNILVKSYTANRVFPIVNPNTKEEFYPPQGRCWRYTQDTIDKMLEENRLYFGKDGKGAPQVKRYLKEVKDGVTPLTLWLRDEVGDNQEGKNELNALFEIPTFDTPKVVRLIKQMLLISTKEDDLILDFFVGSGTTSHAVMDLNKEDGGNRKYICVQLPERCDEKSEAFKAGYHTIADIAKERIRRAAKKIQAEIDAEKMKTKEQFDFEPDKEEPNIDLGFKVLKLSDSNFKQWQQIEGKDANALAQQIKLFVDPVSEAATVENMVYELLLKSGKDLNSKIEKKHGFFSINENEIILMLEKATQEIIDNVISSKPNKVIALDKLFKGNDQLKTNTVLQMKDAGIEFKTI
ncbi:MAG: DNA methyltransferase [Tissierellia bacterium]|nr:DNA methyltransferase [Tissierellia bacterium]